LVVTILKQTGFIVLKSECSRTMTK